MKSRRKLIIGLLVLVVVVTTVAALLGGGDTPTETAIEDDADIAVGTVTITNADKFTIPLSEDKIDELGDMLYTYVEKYQDESGSYDAIIRNGSLNITYHPYQGTGGVKEVPQVKFIADIPEAKKSFTVIQSGGELYPYDIAHVVCVAKNQLKYGDFGCKDEEQ